MAVENQNEGVAFALVIMAGLCTGIGAAAVFFPSIAKLANKRNLASALGLSAGVMIYISLVDIYGKAIGGFEEAGHDGDKSFIYATITFFCGCLFMLVLDMGIALLLKATGQSLPDSHALPAIANGETKNADITGRTQGQSEALANNEEGKVYSGDAATEDGSLESGEGKKEDLMQMGFATALAIALHNFPEGLLTFVGYMQDPAVGIALAVGIAIHNIPEGLCVAMPIYYATGRKWYAFGWAILSGLTEPLGALIGWAVFNSEFEGNAYGIMFGLVAGIMAIIAVDELLPTAHKYDPNGRRVTYFLMLGMFAVALSLMLFSI